VRKVGSAVSAGTLAVCMVGCKRTHPLTVIDYITARLWIATIRLP
jgi:hypothetical protein